MRPVTQINQIYGYLRVSTPEQVRSGVSLRQQENAIRKFVKEKYNRNVDEFLLMMGFLGPFLFWIELALVR